jgi:hypothetical protein
MEISFNFFPRLETFDVLLLQAHSPGADFIRFLLKPKQLLKPLVTAIYDESSPSCTQACKSSSLCVNLIPALTISAHFASYFESLLAAGTFKIAIQDLVVLFKGSMVCGLTFTTVYTTALTHCRCVSFHFAAGTDIMGIVVGVVSAISYIRKLS